MEILRNREKVLSSPNVLISPDIGIAEEIVVPPNHEMEVPILVTDELKQHAELVEKESLRPSVLKFVNTRSHVMQHMLLVSTLGEIADNDTHLRISNLSPNHAKLVRGTRLCYTVEFKKQPISGRELLDRMYTDIFPDDNSWNVLEMNTSYGRMAAGIEFWLKPHLQYTIKKQDGPVVFNGLSESTHNRDFVNSNLEYADQSYERQVWIGEFMSKLFLTPNVHGVISGLHSHGHFFNGQDGFPGTGHFPSMLLKGGQTGMSKERGSDIRVEVFGSTKGSARAATAHVLFFES